MEQCKSTASWTISYLKWTDKDDHDLGADPPESDALEEADVAAGEVFVAAYLEWLEAA